jgi:glycosyltransferase involved in cell wall biosynthesis
MSMKLASFDSPLVSVICLCHNHSAYVAEAIESVLAQNYAPIELIAIDDASIDGSQAVIKELARRHGFQTIFQEKNTGNCKAFNNAFWRCQGQFVIDLAADDVLMPERIARGVAAFALAEAEAGVHFCDVLHISPTGKALGTHHRRDAGGKLLYTVPTGDVYAALLARHVVSAPSMMIRRGVLEALGGYDEALTYEDFDFWVRSSRRYHYLFTDEVLVKKRIVPGSHTQRQYQRKNTATYSTALVCEKALALNESQADHDALQQRIRYELKWALLTENWKATKKLIDVYKAIPHAGGGIYLFIMRLLLTLRLPYHKLAILIKGQK